jgi:periplasmic protein TonB
MLDLTPASVPPWFSVDEVAEAAGVPVEEAWRLVGLGQAVVFPEGSLVSTGDAVHLVRVLRGDVRPSLNRVIFNRIPGPSRAKRRSVAASGLLGLYGLTALVFLLINSLGLMSPVEVVADTKKDAPVRLVYLMMPGPGGGGGGGGLREPRPAPAARKKAEVTLARKTPSRVPPARPRPAPPARPAPPKPEARIEPTPAIDKPVTPAPPPPAVQAPVQSIAADPLETIGLPNESPAAAPSRGSGTGGGVGSGSGQGIGEGSGGGIGPGSGGGTGGGPYQPGSGIDPPTLVREVRPSYTDAARRQAIEGDVVLEIVVRQDGSVGTIRVLRTLGAGLEQKAIEAVRQWRFTPARRRGAAVDVVVQVSVEFKLR